MPIINDVLHITYILNPGAAFGLLEYQTKLFVAVAVILLASLGYYHRWIAAGHWLLRLGVGLLAGGAFGNLIDRIKTGYVVDYLDFRVWPIFNSADIAIVTGVGCLIYILLFLPDTLPGSNLGRPEKEG